MRFMYDAENEDKEQQQALLRSLQLNRAAANLKAHDWAEVLVVCGEALDDFPGEAKALYRRAQANFALQNYDAVLPDCEAAGSAADGLKAQVRIVLMGRVR